MSAADLEVVGSVWMTHDGALLVIGTSDHNVYVECCNARVLYLHKIHVHPGCFLYETAAGKFPGLPWVRIA